METCLSCIACCCSKLGFTQSTDAYKKLQMKPTTTQVSSKRRVVKEEQSSSVTIVKLPKRSSSSQSIRFVVTGKPLKDFKKTILQPWACDDHRIGQLVATLAAVSDCHRIHAERDKTYRRAPDAATMDADATRRQSLAYPGKPRRCMMALAAAEAERTRARTKA
ncbi:hypothetical protein MUK42_11352 [Musa troglodytarum]|uniref:Uncharacterized protein n=1 Tax=Musa troglodytarum TaxID=320322 RepID=A0A9E7KGT0_9LILI|nr:hypothetical protein MUK42_11352 [Musa troglodytarum]